MKISLGFVRSTVALVALSLPFPASGEEVAAVSGLAHTQLFAIGGIGVAGSMSDGERDLRTVLDQPNAAAVLREILSRATQTLMVENASNSILRKLGFQFAGTVDHEEEGRVWEWRLPAQSR